MKNTVTIIAVFTFLTIWMVSQSRSENHLYSAEEIALFHHDVPAFQNRAPIDSSEYFLNSSHCKGCHGYDPQHIAMVDGAGNDVNLYDDWSTTMMAMSAKDPLWRAKVSHEITVNPGTANEVQTFCTGCHAPTGHYTAMYKGQPFYTVADIDTDSLGMDGVSCSGCHAIGPVGLGSAFSGTIPYDTNDIEYGPFQNPVVGNMQLYEGLTPTYSPHTHEGRFCSPCHTLITSSVDLSGTPTGTKFIEQATYHEWVNSIYQSNDTVCQTCHMPQIEDPVILMVGDINLQPRSPFNQHFFTGGNSFMVNLMKNNKLALNINHPDSSFDNTIEQTNIMLRQNSIDLKIDPAIYPAQDSLIINVHLRNKAGHKFPSGYPARRAFVQLVVIQDNGDTLFSSGLFDNDGELHNLPPAWQPHYQVVSDGMQTQVYEMIMGDVNGDETTVLERAYNALKDNRIPPRGFTSTHYAYDTVAIIANAATDPDFNKNGVTEGTGKDVVHYHVALNGYKGIVNVYSKIYYQSIKPSFLNDMFAISTNPIDAFKAMYQNEINMPVLVDADSVMTITTNDGIEENDLQQLRIYPNPSVNGWFRISLPQEKIIRVDCFDLGGKIVTPQSQLSYNNGLFIHVSDRSGTYILRIHTSKGLVTRKVIVT